MTNLEAIMLNTRLNDGQMEFTPHDEIELWVLLYVNRYKDTKTYVTCLISVKNMPTGPHTVCAPNFFF